MLEDNHREVIPSSIAFNDAAVEITFIELRDQSERAGLMKTLVIERARFGGLVDEIIDGIVDLIDAGLLEIRSPSESLDPRKRIGARKAAPVEPEPESDPEDG